MKKAMSYAKEFFHRADIFLLVMGLICAIFGIVVISSATASYHSAKYVIVQSASLILGVFACWTWMCWPTSGRSCARSTWSFCCC